MVGEFGAQLRPLAALVFTNGFGLDGCCCRWDSAAAASRAPSSGSIGMSAPLGLSLRPLPRSVRSPGSAWSTCRSQNHLRQLIGRHAPAGVVGMASQSLPSGFLP
jgi:hypothetical protein